jgi:hypothetical protein
VFLDGGQGRSCECACASSLMDDPREPLIPICEPGLAAECLRQADGPPTQGRGRAPARVTLSAPAANFPLVQTDHLVSVLVGRRFELRAGGGTPLEAVRCSWHDLPCLAASRQRFCAPIRLHNGLLPLQNRERSGGPIR